MAKRQAQPLPTSALTLSPAKINASTKGSAQSKFRLGWMTGELPVRVGVAEFGAGI
jgi:hypothetical protein